MYYITHVTAEGNLTYGNTEYNYYLYILTVDIKKMEISYQF